MCNCKSYNWDKIGSIVAAILTLPKWCDVGRENRTVCIDKCIVGVIVYLWAHGIETLGCCCGHNIKNPSVVVNSGQNVDCVFKVIRRIDSRDWIVCRWELVEHQMDNLGGN